MILIKLNYSIDVILNGNCLKQNPFMIEKIKNFINIFSEINFSWKFSLLMRNFCDEMSFNKIKYFKDTL